MDPGYCFVATYLSGTSAAVTGSPPGNFKATRQNLPACRRGPPAHWSPRRATRQTPVRPGEASGAGSSQSPAWRPVLRVRWRMRGTLGHQEFIAWQSPMPQCIKILAPREDFGSAQRFRCSAGHYPRPRSPKATLRRGGYIFGCGPQAALCIRRRGDGRRWCRPGFHGI